MARRKRFNRAFIRLTREGKVVPSSVVLRASMPKQGTWQEIVYDACCPTTTSTSSTTTTTTT